MEILTGIFENRTTAEKVVEELRAAGFSNDRIGFLTPGDSDRKVERTVPLTDSERPGMGRAMGAAVGGAVGAAGGASLGAAAASLLVPGVGPVIAVGLIGAALLGTAGAVAIGARGPLIAFNAYLDTDNVEIAHYVARAVRTSGGGLPYLKALGLLVQGQAQVSMNVVDFRHTSLHTILESVRVEAHKYGAAITRTELVGLIPQAALLDTALEYLQLLPATRDLILEKRLGAMIGSVSPLAVAISGQSMVRRVSIREGVRLMRAAPRPARRARPAAGGRPGDHRC